MTNRLLFLVTALMVAGPLRADDWPQFRGPDRSGISKETGLLKQWPKDGPPLVWTYQHAGIGYSGPAIVGDRLYMMGARDNVEYLYALDLQGAAGPNVKEVWAVKIGPMLTWKGNSFNAGPSATPTVDGDLVFGLGGQGELVCVQASTGKESWRKNLPSELGAEVNPIGGGPEKLGWGFTWSPLVDGNRLICVPGGSSGTLAALDTKTGRVIWRSKELTDQATYSSPLVAELHGVRQYIQMTNNGTAGVRAGDGKLLWYYHPKSPYSDVVIATPVVQGEDVYTTAVPEGCDLFQVSRADMKWSTRALYSNRNLSTRTGVVLVDGRIYGHAKSKGWVCQDFRSGKILWTERRQLGPGSLTAAAGDLYCFGEDEGIAVLVEANPKRWAEKGRFEIPQKSTRRLPDGKLWTHPVIANGRLYLRDQELLFCYDIRDKK